MNIFRHFQQKIPMKLREGAEVLQKYALYEKRNRLLVDLRVAHLHKDEHAAEETVAGLRSLPLPFDDES